MSSENNFFENDKQSRKYDPHKQPRRDFDNTKPNPAPFLHLAFTLGDLNPLPGQSN